LFSRSAKRRIAPSVAELNTAAPVGTLERSSGARSDDVQVKDDNRVSPTTDVPMKNGAAEAMR
jgi:hypothetical protein